MLEGLPQGVQDAWAQAFAEEGEHSRNGDLIRLGGVTRIVVARPMPGSPSLRAG